MDDWQELVDWMRSPEVQAAVARQLAQAEEEEPPEPEQLVMRLDAPRRGRAGA